MAGPNIDTLVKLIVPFQERAVDMRRFTAAFLLGRRWPLWPLFLFRAAETMPLIVAPAPLREETISLRIRHLSGAVRFFTLMSKPSTMHILLHSHVVRAVTRARTKVPSRSIKQQQSPPFSSIFRCYKHILFYIKCQ